MVLRSIQSIKQLNRFMSSTNYVLPEAVWLTGPKETKFFTRYFSPEIKPKAGIVFIHGFAEHIARYSHFHPKFIDRGISVFTFDQRGFGRTGQDEEMRSKGSTYGKTNWKDQMEDIAWAIETAKAKIGDAPLFLMGHSMGGGEVLGFATQENNGLVSSISGVIATSPLIQQASPSPKLLTWVGGKASILAPYALIPAPVNADDLSHSEAVNKAYMEDPLVKQSGSLKGISDMLSNGDELLKSYYKNWPTTLPLLICHGTEDKVTSNKASQAFIDKISATDKAISLYEGGYHELQNEPNGVSEKLFEEVVQFIEKRTPIPTPTATAPIPEAAAPNL